MKVTPSTQKKGYLDDLSLKYFTHIKPLLEAVLHKTKPLEVDLHISGTEWHLGVYSQGLLHLLHIIMANVSDKREQKNDRAKGRRVSNSEQGVGGWCL